MILNKHLKQFADLLVTKKLPVANTISFNEMYWRLFWTRRITEFAFTLMLVYAGTNLLFLTHYSPIWSFSGVAVSALYLRGLYVLPAIALGLFIGFITHDYAWIFSAKQSILFTFLLFCVRQIGIHFIGAIIPFNTIFDYIKWLLLILTFIILHIMSLMIGAAQTQQLSAILAELSGILCLTPLCLIFTPFMPKFYFRLNQWPWMVSGILILSLHSLYFFIPSTYLTSLSIAMFLCIIGFARFGKFPLCILLLALSVIYIAGAEGDNLFQESVNAYQPLILSTLFVISVVFSLGLSILWQEKKHQMYL